jgi:hypothetical protein
LEAELEKLGFPSLTIFRPSVLAGDREQQRFVESMAQTVVKILTPLLTCRLQISHAMAVAASLLDGAVEAPPGVHIKTNDNMTRLGDVPL